MTRASAPGKLNIYFAVGPLRANGYHDVASVYQALNLLEIVSVSPGENWKVETSGNLSDQQRSQIPTGEENLVVRAAIALARKAGFSNPQTMHFQIQKQVPVAGGMGGGSADAAAALLALNDSWCLGFTSKQLQEVAAQIGADVPFSLQGETAVGLGTGTELTTITSVDLNWVMVLSDSTLSTPAVFKKLDELRKKNGINPGEVDIPLVPESVFAALTESPEEVAKQMHNDLHEPAMELLPELRQLSDLGERLGALRTMVSGSGPTVAMLATDESAAIKLASDLRQRGFNAIACHGPVSGATLLDD